ncbi:MAG: methionyl-tRNA formyltransferase [Campylobacterales bacterium]|nr:methionyl-tRNA formyltransferase [Campylobacterales bacterium]
MRVIFMGTPEYAAEILRALIETPLVEVVAVYTQPDKPVGRKMVLTPPPVKVLAAQHDITVYQPQRLREPSVVETLLAIPCDFIVVAAYGQILPKAILEHAPCINLHASILPKYRGASPIQQALLDNASETGVSAMLMDEGLDTGAVLLIERIAIGPDETAESLFERLTRLAARMTPEVLGIFATLTPTAQVDAEATYCKKIVKSDGEVCFDNALGVYNRYRAFTPWPGIFLKNGLKLKKIAPAPEFPSCRRSGEILHVDHGSIIVGTPCGALRIFTLQPPSKKEMSSVDYINGARLKVADLLA